MTNRARENYIEAIALVFMLMAYLIGLYAW